MPKKDYTAQVARPLVCLLTWGETILCMRDYFDWAKDAACKEADPTLFDSSDPYYIDVAKRICKTCPVKRECLRHGIVYDEGDIWGGLSEKERHTFVTDNDRRQLANEMRQAGIFHPELIVTPIP